MLDKAIRKINEVAQDLREPQVGADLEHQAKKLDRVVEDLTALRDLMVGDEPTASPQVHGGGTGGPED